MLLEGRSEGYLSAESLLSLPCVVDEDKVGVVGIKWSAVLVLREDVELVVVAGKITTALQHIACDINV